MNLYENFKMALDSILSNKMRSFLTMLGIIIGISSVISIVALGQGGQEAINSQFLAIGTNNVNITIDATKAGQSDYFNLQDVKSLKDKISTVQYAGVQINKTVLASSDKIIKSGAISGGDADYPYLRNIEMSYGRFYSDKEVSEAKNVAVITDDSAKLLFGYEDCVGKQIKVGANSTTKTLTIIGVTKTTSFFAQGKNQKVTIYVPITYLQTMYSEKFQISSITLTATSQGTTEIAGNQAKNLLSVLHGNKNRDLYTVDNAFKSLAQISQILGIFTTFIGAVAGISLLVGGIGVMNIMLVSVTERTREIGLRKSIGATTWNILMQFLIEAVIISLIGGIVGLALGIAIAEIAGYFVNVVPTLSIPIIFAVILFSSLIGIFFGIYPANKAAKLNPIDALRYE